MAVAFWIGDWARRLGISCVLCAALVGCSMPDGPNPDDPDRTAEAPPPEITLNGPGQLLPITAMATIRSEQFELEVAETPSQQSLGLMFRSALPSNRGMLFPFGAPRRASFWMKDVPVPLDMVFIRASEVVAIAAEVPPCPALPCPSYGPDAELVDQVLELRSGRAAELGLQPGDRIEIQMLADPSSSVLD
ncbi:MAG: DUF192 domain-containing protein [Cyanobacteria bacterium J06614_10]